MMVICGENMGRRGSMAARSQEATIGAVTGMKQAAKHQDKCNNKALVIHPCSWSLKRQNIHATQYLRLKLMDIWCNIVSNLMNWPLPSFSSLTKAQMMIMGRNNPIIRVTMEELTKKKKKHATTRTAPC
ncbi:uncharacterized protein LOC122003878 [Zingiber officinale]|uniref:uncharacterized protein LOC122003878 n=1 Tax=Zingiber officinale TaxID=94328 RepID=UPI001C4CB3E3|nr:uncharacterized protein LOC122003878 [Zingiber officinale]